MKDEVAALEALEIRLFLQAIAERWGYDLRGYAEPSLHRRVRAVLAASGAANLGELQHRVLHDRGAFTEALEGLTVRVTELFRDPEVYRALRSRVVPLLRTYPLLNVWHAGCATGEEAYSMAILLREEGLGDRTQIYATDLSPHAIDRAKDGVYAARDLLRFTKNHSDSGGRSELADWITAAYDGVAMREPLRRQILFFQHDLVADQAFGEMQVVFCRNVLIYFGAELRRQVMDKIAASLRPGGFLCLGTSERLADPTPDPRFTPFCADERIYRYEP
jgi:chemotaxis protein methyltransferase CheR